MVKQISIPLQPSITSLINASKATPTLAKGMVVSWSIFTDNHYFCRTMLGVKIQVLTKVI